MSSCIPTAQTPPLSISEQLAEAAARQKAAGFVHDDRVCPNCGRKHWGHADVCLSCTQRREYL